jgi:hypothetical protein
MGTGVAVIVTISWRRCMLWFDLDLCLFGMFFRGQDWILLDTVRLIVFLCRVLLLLP